MKITHSIYLVTAAFCLANCNSSNQFDGSDLDPLRAPGMSGNNSASAVTPEHKSGSYVKTIVNSTAFFATRLGDGSTAEMLLPAGTMLRVIKPDRSFTNVELDDGKLGYVATAALATASAETQIPPADGQPLNLPDSAPLPPSATDTGTTLPPSSLPDQIPTPPIAPPPLPNPGDTLPPSGTGLPPSSLDAPPR